MRPAGVGEEDEASGPTNRGKAGAAAGGGGGATAEGTACGAI
jgi:hypothetical protein